MLGAAFGHTVGKFRKAGFPEEMDILDFHITGWALCIFQENVDAAVLAVLNFVSQRCITYQFRNFSLGYGLGHDAVWLGRIDADKPNIANSDKLPGVGIFSGWTL